MESTREPSNKCSSMSKLINTSLDRSALLYKILSSIPTEQWGNILPDECSKLLDEEQFCFNQEDAEKYYGYLESISNEIKTKNWEVKGRLLCSSPPGMMDKPSLIRWLYERFKDITRQYKINNGKNQGMSFRPGANRGVEVPEGVFELWKKFEIEGTMELRDQWPDNIIFFPCASVMPIKHSSFKQSYKHLYEYDELHEMGAKGILKCRVLNEYLRNMKKIEL